MTPATKTRTLSTAEERRAELTDAAVTVFAERGYAAGTMDIAKAAGISQAYLFRLFPTKPELFVAAYEAASRRMAQTFRDAANLARAEGRDPLQEMGHAYGDLIDRDRDLLRMQLHAQVAAGTEPLVRDAVQRCFGELFELVQRESGAEPEDLQPWFAHGMLCNVMASIGADQLDAEWAKALTKSGHPEA
jgi:AcrR family transcriptional regulator